MLNNLSVRRRLVAGFGTVLLSMGALTSFGGWGMWKQAQEMDRLAANVSNTRTNVITWSNAIERNLIRTEVILRGSAGALEDKLKADMKETSALVDKLQPSIEQQLDDSSIPAFKAVLEARQQYTKTRKEAFQLQNRGIDVSQLYERDVLPAVVRYQLAVSTLVKHQEAYAATLVEQAHHRAISAILVLFGLGGTLIATGLAFALWVGRSIVAPLDQTKSVLQNVANGNLSARVPVSGSDEIAQVGSSLNTALAGLSQSVENVSSVSHQVDQSMHSMVDAIAELGNRTQLQAMAVEESALALQNLTLSASNAQTLGSDAMRQTHEIRKTSAGGQAAMLEVSNYMTTLSLLNKQISTVVRAIDEMALKTNMLALNAGVEAARAGDAGKGFAVVATEVRALATKSSSEASTIKDLLERMSHNLTQCHSATQKAQNAVEAGGSCASAVSHAVAELVSQVTAQAEVLSSVSSAFSALEHVTQENADFVGKGGETARNLQNQVTSLRSSVDHFKV